jgi:hypothetical protein
MTDAINRQYIIDDEHLKLLSIGYMIAAGFSAFFGLFGFFYVFMGIMMGEMFRHAPEFSAQANQPPPAFVGWLFAGIGIVFILVSFTLAILKFLVASSIKHRKSRIFCMVVAGITCLGFPYGTALGVMTFIALGRESVVRLFDAGAAPQQPS